MERFEGRTAIVTGASRGIGRAIAARLVAEGARVVITARKEPALAEAAERLGGPDRVRFAPGRADDPEARAAAFGLAEAAFGPVDLLVNNTGINPAYGPALEIEEGAVRKMFEVNVLGAFGWAREAVARGMGERGGAIVNVASIAGVGASPRIAFYGVTKAALISLTQQLAVELAPRIRVNAVAPAVVRTAFARPLYEGREAEVARAYPLGRLGEPEDVAGPVAFLLSDDAAWVTGRTLVIDGGGSLPMPA
ncbi:SDR family oxidoreductase [Amnibacterium sp. CER49]|uniref:SDR family oxidoreductase n=1 Tax=Amnibacterium sp. CER49 TaxID=3039161 RepID=UPI00244A654A|nr:SDR family oxidoreductase [Amnibacterium sp. CER49]MDH2444930.1 SDR family oxidoreductase [Amnibacterium sp. CER49]